MVPKHHLPEEILLAYAAGTTAEAVSVLVASHLTLCPICRRDLAGYEAAGGALLDSLQAQVAPDLFTRLAARLDDEPAPSAPAPELPAAAEPWPRPLLSRAGMSRRWRMLVPGAHHLPLGLQLGAEPARLVRLAPRFRVEQHGHLGSELTLILEGSLVDSGERYVRGDVIVRDPSIQHEQLVDAAEACICFIVRDAPLVPLTWKGRLIHLLRPSV